MTKERLQQYRQLQRELRQIQDRIMEVESAMYSPRNQRLTGMPSAHSAENVMEKLVDKHRELEVMYQEKLMAITEELLAIEKAIATLDPTLRLLMRYRYVDGYRWEDICVKMNYSYQGVHKVHRKALKRIRDL